MKTRTKLSIITPILLLAILLAANFATIFAQSTETSNTTTPIKHVVVIFQENVSFDHYFGTYPNAANPPNEPKFTPAPGTPTVNGLSGPLLTSNPNELVTGNLSDNPARLDRTQPVTCDNDHDYTAEQAAFNGGLMNMFPEQTSCSDGIVMDYYDGNTATALWNYAQGFALNDNFFGTTFGPSTPGALNLVSGIGGPMIATLPNGSTSSNVSGVLANGQVIGDSDPTFDDCSAGTTIAMTPTNGTAAPQNIGNLLNNAGLTWGWFQGGFTPTVPYNPLTDSKAICGSSHVQVNGTTEADYSAHHEPFQYFASTSNPHHLPPNSSSMIGYTDQANHQYDLSSFWIAADSGNLPAVSFLKADRYQDGHPSNSDPLDEQTWLVNTINKLESLPSWSSTAIFITWDDSDGWYDHVMGPIVNPSNDPANDVLNGNTCGAGTSPLGVQDRCGYGPRIPLLVISPYAKQNFVDNTLADQTSITKFIENNWNLGSISPQSYDNLSSNLFSMFNFNHPWKGSANALFLNPSTGERVSVPATASQGRIGLSSTSMCTDQDTNPDVCALQSNFNTASIGNGDYVWFNSVLNLNSQVPSAGLTLHFSGQWIFVQLKNGSVLNLPAPNVQLTYSPSATTATTNFTGGQWVTTVPSNYTGKVFLSGLAYQVPAGVSLKGAKVTWTGGFIGTNSSFHVKWEWAAAAYSGFGNLSTTNTTTLYNGLGIKPIDAKTGSPYLDNNRAGTPENFETNLISGGTGRGGTDYTGSYSQQGIAQYQTYLLNE
jgi:phospholipase C